MVRQLDKFYEFDGFEVDKVTDEVYHIIKKSKYDQIVLDKLIILNSDKKQATFITAEFNDSFSISEISKEIKEFDDEETLKRSIERYLFLKSL